jgi:hypothetical protein
VTPAGAIGAPLTAPALLVDGIDPLAAELDRAPLLSRAVVGSAGGARPVSTGDGTTGATLSLAGTCGRSGGFAARFGARVVFGATGVEGRGGVGIRTRTGKFGPMVRSRRTQLGREVIDANAAMNSPTLTASETMRLGQRRSVACDPNRAKRRSLMRHPRPPLAVMLVRCRYVVHNYPGAFVLLRHVMETTTPAMTVASRARIPYV